MKISGYEEKCVRLLDGVRVLCQRNYYFANLWNTLEKSNLEIIVFGEKELLEDPHNAENH